ncbi:MAG: hypothetical protein IT559_06325 [Alphaproteobacteria bacterium]|nr:hypothetical protein [Alphaproteobacteria bacterium]
MAALRTDCTLAHLRDAAKGGIEPVVDILVEKGIKHEQSDVESFFKGEEFDARGFWDRYLKPKDPEKEISFLSDPKGYIAQQANGIKTALSGIKETASSLSESIGGQFSSVINAILGFLPGLETMFDGILAKFGIGGDKAATENVTMADTSAPEAENAAPKGPKSAQVKGPASPSSSEEAFNAGALGLKEAPPTIARIEQQQQALIDNYLGKTSELARKEIGDQLNVEKMREPGYLAQVEGIAKENALFLPADTAQTLATFKNLEAQRQALINAESTPSMAAAAPLNTQAALPKV